MTKVLVRSLAGASIAGLLALVSADSTTAQPSCPAMKPGKYAVKIDSAPQGATITLAAGCPPLGLTPWEGKLDTGRYTVTLQAPGYETATRPFKVARVRKLQELFVPLIKKPDIDGPGGPPIPPKVP